ncbi:hypothetical protein ACWDWV_05140 [Streptosporangium sandarakinum]
MSHLHQFAAELGQGLRDGPEFIEAAGPPRQMAGENRRDAAVPGQARQLARRSVVSGTLELQVRDAGREPAPYHDGRVRAGRCAAVGSPAPQFKIILLEIGFRCTPYMGWRSTRSTTTSR